MRRPPRKTVFRPPSPRYVLAPPPPVYFSYKLPEFPPAFRGKIALDGGSSALVIGTSELQKLP